jgi:hypothetical protein
MYSFSFTRALDRSERQEVVSYSVPEDARILIIWWRWRMCTLKGKLFSSAILYMKLDNISINICCKISRGTEADNKFCMYSSCKH